jgi:superfamily II DNA or RNA helicase
MSDNKSIYSIKREISLRFDQEEILEKILAYLQTNDRGILALPTGYGKTLLIKAITDRTAQGIVMIISPTISQNNQTIKVSNETTFKDEGDLTPSLDSQLNFSSGKKYIIKSTLDESECVRFLIENINKRSYIFTTYNSLNKLYDLIEENKIPIDMIIFDEAHHCLNIKYDNVKKSKYIKKFLYITATPKYSSEDKKLSMNNEEIYGKIVAQKSIKECIELGILNSFQFIFLSNNNSIINSFVLELRKLIGNTSNSYDDKFLLNCAIIWACLDKKEYKVDNILVYCSNIYECENYKKFFENHKEIFRIETETYHSGKDGKKSERNKQNEETLQKFEKGEIKVIFSVDALKEGIDIPEAQSVMILSNITKSIPIVQIIGRILRKKEGKNISKIICPFDKNNPDKNQYHLMEIFQALESNEIIEHLDSNYYKYFHHFHRMISEYLAYNLKIDPDEMAKLFNTFRDILCRNVPIKTDKKEYAQFLASFINKTNNIPVKDDQDFYQSRMAYILYLFRIEFRTIGLDNEIETILKSAKQNIFDDSIFGLEISQKVKDAVSYYQQHKTFDGSGIDTIRGNYRDGRLTPYEINELDKCCESWKESYGLPKEAYPGFRGALTRILRQDITIVKTAQSHFAQIRLAERDCRINPYILSKFETEKIWKGVFDNHLTYDEICDEIIRLSRIENIDKDDEEKLNKYIKQLREKKKQSDEYIKSTFLEYQNRGYFNYKIIESVWNKIRQNCEDEVIEKLNGDNIMYNM